MSCSRIVFRALALVVAAAGAAGAARAGSPADLGIEFKTAVQGNDAPRILVKNTRDVRKLDVVLTDKAGHKQTVHASNMGAGSTRNLPFKHGQGTMAYGADLAVEWGDGEKDSFHMDFEATRVGKLVMDIKSEDVDIDGHTVQARVSNPAASIEMSIVGESGNELWSGRDTFDPVAPAGTDLKLAWDEASVANEKILFMQLKVYDIAGYWVGMKITPFSIEIPHDELVFDTGSSVVRTDQEPKLATTMGYVQDALKKHGTLLQLRLYIAGFTDTVGDKASNRGLSLARAHAIAAWFRKRGLTVPIYYAGFGEEVLAKETPDETEEQANRRAIYILSTQTPSGKDVPRNEWHPL